ncbi:MAG: histidinol-phosphatase [Spirochaetaceae bacterium]|jgi:histidinol-phosphatase (PHP family)|nr:histidinol-phosphatase [Spirochaetaceae bacterium]
MRYSCLHTHTYFCDGHGGIEEFCETAYKKNFVSLGFSAHAPVSKKTGLSTNWHLKDERLDEYCREVRAARERWHGKLDVYLGLEVDYIEDGGTCILSADDFRNSGQGLNYFDYLIGSVHYVTPRRCVDCPPDEFENLIREDFGGDAMALADAYWDRMERMIAKGGFDIIAHADIIKKNNKNDKWFSTKDEHYLKRIDRIASIIAESGLVTEVNTGGLNRGVTTEPYPSQRLLRALQKKNAPVMINADAHKPEHLGGFYNEARAFLLEAGFKHISLFEGRVNGKALWKTDPL